MMNLEAARTHHASTALAGARWSEAGRQAWEAKDGTPVHVRPIQPGDFELEREFADGLSSRTRYLRLMSPRKPSTAELERWTNIDRAREGALIATVSSDGQERQIGVARYAMEADDGEAEIAIVVSDAWQRTGLGTHLLSALVELARQSGVRRLFGTTLSENTAMRALARRLGFKLSLEPGAASLTRVSLALRPDV